MVVRDGEKSRGLGFWVSIDERGGAKKVARERQSAEVTQQ